MDFSTFITSIIFILPGFIIISTKNLFSYTKDINTFHKILQSIIATIPLWLFILFISKFSIFNFIDNILKIIISFDKNELFENKINITLFLLEIYFISFVVGIIIGLLFYRCKKIRNILYYAYINIFKQTLYKHIWEELFTEFTLNKDSLSSIIVKTTNGDIFLGSPYLISHNSNDRAISFSELYKLNDKNEFELIISYDNTNTANNLFYIKDSSIEYLYIINNDKIANNLKDKLR